MPATPLIFAHRGASQVAPENTLPAFELAFRSGAEWIECDVMTSSDDELFIIHDDTLDRTTNGSGLVYETPAATLKKLDAGTWFGPEFQRTSIPRLQDLFILLARYGTHANLELKATADANVNQHTARLLAAALPGLRAQAPESEIVVSSFDHEALFIFAKLSPETPIALLVDIAEIQDVQHTLEALQDTVKRFKQLVSLNVNDINLKNHTQPLSAKCLKQLQAIYPEICVYTVNDPERAAWLVQHGVKGIFTDTQKFYSNA